MGCTATTSTMAARVHSLHHILHRHLGAILVGVILLNLVDAFSTLLVVTAGVATEANPLMAALLDTSPLLFLAGKLGLVSLGTWVLWRLRSSPLAAFGGFAVLLAYGAIAVYHVRSFEHLRASAAVAGL
jgi:hypothetical protein